MTKCDLCGDVLGIFARSFNAYDGEISIHFSCYEVFRARWDAINMLFPVHLAGNNCSDKELKEGCPRCDCLIYQLRMGYRIYLSTEPHCVVKADSAVAINEQ